MLSIKRSKSKLINLIVDTLKCFEFLKSTWKSKRTGPTYVDFYYIHSVLGSLVIFTSKRPTVALKLFQPNLVKEHD